MPPRRTRPPRQAGPQLMPGEIERSWKERHDLDDFGFPRFPCIGCGLVAWRRLPLGATVCGACCLGPDDHLPRIRPPDLVNVCRVAGCGRQLDTWLATRCFVHGHEQDAPGV